MFRSMSVLIILSAIILCAKSSFAAIDASRLSVAQALDLIESQIYASASSDAPSPMADMAEAPAVPTTPALEEATKTQEETKTLLGEWFKQYGMEEPTGSITLDYYNRYVWRGQYLDRDGVLQPGISLSAAGFTAGYWSSWDMRNTDPLTSDESDFYLSYSYTVDKYTLSAGHTWYSFPGYGSSSKEFYLSLGVDMLLSPVLTFVHDYEDGKDFGMGDGNYYSLGISHSFDVDPKHGITLTVGTALGFIDHQWINGRGYHFTPTLALDIPITKNMTISPTVGYNFTGGDLSDPDIGNQEDHGFGGVHTSISF